MMRNKKILQSQLFAALIVGLAVTGCSKKKKADGEVAGDTAVQTSELPATPAAGQKIPELATIYFEFDSFNLSRDAKSKLDANAAWLKSNPSRAVQVEGHTDERGTTEYNLALGERRAAAVKDYLVTKGVPATQLSTISYGEERPANAGHDEAAWSQNRRGEFVSQ